MKAEDLIREYRPTMPEEVLHAWAKDVVKVMGDLVGTFCMVVIAGAETHIREFSGRFTTDDHYFMAEAADLRPSLPDGLYRVPVRWTSEPTGGEALVPVFDWDHAALSVTEESA